MGFTIQSSNSYPALSELNLTPVQLNQFLGGTKRTCTIGEIRAPLRINSVKTYIVSLSILMVVF